MCKQKWQTCENLLGKIIIHRFLLLIGVSLENVSIMNEDY